MGSAEEEETDSTAVASSGACWPRGSSEEEDTHVSLVSVPVCTRATDENKQVFASALSFSSCAGVGPEEEEEDDDDDDDEKVVCSNISGAKRDPLH